jgi:endo-1,4-beta-xylanase
MTCNQIIAALTAALGLLIVNGASAATVLPCSDTPPPITTIGGSPPSLREGAQRHDLFIGSAISFNLPGPYLDTLAREFSMLTPENSMKFASLQPFQGVYDFCTADAMVRFARDHGMKVRGHTLVWHNQNPPWLTNGTFTREQLIDILRDHIHTVIGHYRDNYPGTVIQWDVVNEAVADCAGPTACGLRNNLWRQIIGPDYIDLAYQFAREADSGAQLFYNDYGIEYATTNSSAKREGVKALVGDLVSRGIPVDGVGFQLHTGAGAPDPAVLDGAFSDIERIGLSVAVTELDVGIGADALDVTPTQDQLGRQALSYRRVLDACLAHPTCNTFVMWGFTDLRTYRLPDQPLIYDRTFTPKPAYHALRNRLLEGLAIATLEVLMLEGENMTVSGPSTGTTEIQPADGRRLRRSGDSLSSRVAISGTTGYSINITARGFPASGDYPSIRISWDGVPVATVTINSETWKTYSVPIAGSVGSHLVAITFLNDLSANGEDRDVDIDKVTISTATIEAENAYTKDGGVPIPGGWAFLQNGELETSTAIWRDGLYEVNVLARGTFGGGAWPTVSLRVNGITVASTQVASTSWTTVKLLAPLPRGTHDLALAFDTDWCCIAGDRNLYLDSFSITGAPSVDAGSLP